MKKMLRKSMMLAGAVAVAAGTWAYAVSAHTPLAKLRVQAPQTMEQMARQAMEQNRSTEGMYRMMAPRHADEQSRWEAVIDEDFSLFTAGSEEAIDETFMPEAYFETGAMDLDDALFHTPGWSGVGVYQAGGMAALAYPRMGGLINTPFVEMQGHLKVTVRVKAIEARFILMMSIVAGDYWSPYDPGCGDRTQAQDPTLMPDDGWQELTFEVVNPSAEPCALQMNGMAYNSGKLLIDYIKVERDLNYVATPSGLKAEGFVTDGFTAAWDAASGAESYKVDLYKMEAIGGNVMYEESLDNLAADEEGNLTGLSQGWSGKVTPTTDGVVAEGNGSGNAIRLATSDDYIELDCDGKYVVNISYDANYLVKGAESYAHLDCQVYDPELDDWMGWNITPTKGPGEWISDVATESFQGFTSGYQGRFTKVRFHVGEIGLARMIGLSEVDEVFLVDNIKIETTPELEVSPVSESVATEQTEYTFTGLDMQHFYGFTVTGVGAEGESNPSKMFKAQGVAAPEPLPATDLDERGAYTANWLAAHHANAYILNSYEIYTLEEPKTDYVIMEENFDACKEGDKETGMKSLGNFSRISLDNYTDNPGWIGSGTLLCNGMVGCVNMDYESHTTFSMLSPMMDLSNNGGQYTVTVSFELENAYEQFVVQGGMETYQIIEPNGELARTVQITLDKGHQHTDLMFYTVNGTPFLLDKVVVSQNLQQGDRLHKLLKQMETQDLTMRVNELEIKDNHIHAYSLQSVYDNYGDIYYSDYSDYMTVDLAASGIEALEQAGISLENAEFYDLQGRRVYEPQEGIYVVKSGEKTVKVIIR